MSLTDLVVVVLLSNGQRVINSLGFVVLILYLMLDSWRIC